MRTIIAIVGSLMLAGAFAAEPAPISIAIFDLQSPEEGIRDAGVKLSALIAGSLSADPRLILVERGEIEKLLGEQELGLSGAVASETAAKVGRVTGAQVLVTGRLIRAGNEILVVCKIIGTETSRVFGATTKIPQNGSFADAAHTLSEIIGAICVKNMPALTTGPEGMEEVVAKIKRELPEGPKPLVSVHIPEQHFGRPVIDPAAETEILLILQKCGFQIVDKGEQRRPEYLFEGEAFSERAMQKGNLVSCKARVEVKLHKVSNGDLLSVDRETGVAVDLSEHVAAKLALQNAARSLAGRLVRQMVK